MPFGGVGYSGIGHYYGEDGFDALTHAKSILVSPPDVALSTFSHPTLRFRLVADPGEAIGFLPGFNAAHNFQSMQIDYGDVTVRRAGYVDARPVGLHKNSGSALSYFYTL